MVCEKNLMENGFHPSILATLRAQWSRGWNRNGLAKWVGGVSEPLRPRWRGEADDFFGVLNFFSVSLLSPSFPLSLSLSLPLSPSLSLFSLRFSLGSRPKLSHLSPFISLSRARK